MTVRLVILKSSFISEEDFFVLGGKEMKNFLWALF